MSEELSNLRRDETMTSLQIAEIAGKQHKDVLEAIRKAEISADVQNYEVAELCRAKKDDFGERTQNCVR